MSVWKKRIRCFELKGICQYFLKADSLVGNYCIRDMKKIAKNQCKYCDKAKFIGITREQFIMVVAKAICKTDGESCITCGFNGNEKGCKQYLEIGNYITQAEAVLEDILEEKK